MRAIDCRPFGKQFYVGLGGLLVLLFAVGCAATQTFLEKSDLKVDTLMSETVFMDLDKQTKKTVFIDVKNTTGKNIDIAKTLQEDITAKGYTIVPKPHEAAYLLQVNILYVGQTNISSLRETVDHGFGSKVVERAVAAASPKSPSTDATASAAGAAAEMLDYLSGAAVKDVTYTVMTDVQLIEKTNGKGTNHKVRVASTANKVNLKWKDAEDVLIPALEKSLAGMF